MSSPQPKGVADAIDAYYATLPRQSTTTQVAGVRVICPPEERAVDEIRRKYERDRASLNDLLDRSSAKVTAIVPKDLWNRVIQGNGLIDFAPDRNGFVDVSFANWKRLIDKMEKRLFMAYFFIPTLFGEIWMWWAISRTHTSTPVLDHTMSSIVVLLVCFVVLFFGGMFYSKIRFNHEDAAVRRMAAKLVLKDRPEALADAFSRGPNFELNNKGYNTGSYKHMQMILPRAPETVAATLRALEAWGGLRFALDPRTLVMSHPIEDLVLTAWDDKVRERFRLSARVADENFGVVPNVEPVLFGFTGDAVAIFGTYAPIDLERLLLDAISAPVGSVSGRAVAAHI